MASAIFDKQGRLLVAANEEQQHDFDSMCLKDAALADQVLEGANFDGAELIGADCRRTDLYWARFFHANCSGANFREADLRGAVLDGASFVGADLTGARLGLDNLGGATSLLGTDLTDAVLLGTDLHKAEYSEATHFPADFNPAAAGMVLLSSH